MILVYLILILTTHSSTPEQSALDFFKNNIYLDATLYKKPHVDDEPNSIYLGTLIPDKFVCEQFLNDYTLFVKSTADRYPQNNSYPDSLELKLDGQILFDRKIRIAKEVNKELTSRTYLNQKDSQNPTTLIITKPYFSSEQKYDPTNDKWLYVEVSKAIFTGQEYYVELNLYTNYYGPFEYNDVFGYRFIFDLNLDIVDWTTVY